MEHGYLVFPRKWENVNYSSFLLKFQTVVGNQRKKQTYVSSAIFRKSMKIMPVMTNYAKRYASTFYQWKPCRENSRKTVTEGDVQGPFLELKFWITGVD